MKAEELAIRKKIISLHDKKKPTREIAYLLDISKSKAAFWVKRYKTTGSLDDKPRSGKPAKLNKEQFEQIKKVLNDFPPSKYGGESIGWDSKMLLNYIKDNFKVTFGMRYAEKIMHKCGIALITPRVEHKNSSHAARVVYRMDFKKNSKKNIWIAPSLISTK
jgi:transposase